MSDKNTPQDEQSDPDDLAAHGTEADAEYEYVQAGADADDDEVDEEEAYDEVDEDEVDEEVDDEVEMEEMEADHHRHDEVAAEVPANNEDADVAQDAGLTSESERDEPTFLPSSADIAPTLTPREKMSGPAVGIRRADAAGLELIDALAGRSSAFGWGAEPIIDAIQGAAELYLGDAAALVDRPVEGNDSLLRQFQELPAASDSLTVDSIAVCSSAEMALETAINWVRQWKPDAYRVLTLVGSDHGRSGVCRTASGRPELHEGYGPMMAGFAHLPVGDIDALRASVDEQTAGVLLSPVDFSDSLRPLDADYLIAVRQLCDENDLMLIFDESRLCFASSGQPFVFSAITEIQADTVILGGGLFAGLPGGIILASRRLTGESVIDTSKYPLLVAVASTTLAQITQHGLPRSAGETMREFAVAVAELVGGFEFVRDVHVLGMNIGIETDIASDEIVQSAASRGLRIEASGTTGIRMQLPLRISDADREALLLRLGETMEVIERTTAEMSV